MTEEKIRGGIWEIPFCIDTTCKIETLTSVYDPVIGLVLYATNSLQSFDFSSVYLLSISKGSFSTPRTSGR